VEINQEDVVEKNGKAEVVTGIDVRNFEQASARE
jgi:hypothetical protein